MPYQAVAYYGHPVACAEVNELIGLFKAELPFFGLDFGTFHAVFGYNGIEMLFYDSYGSGVTA